jgi:predicted aspartyl protease
MWQSQYAQVKKEKWKNENEYYDRTTGNNCVRQVKVTKKSSGILINGVKAVLDTGSNHNLINKQVLKDKNWDFERQQVENTPVLSQADGSQLIILGKVKLGIKLKDHNKMKKIKFFLSPDIRDNMLIGLQSLRKLHWIANKWPEKISEMNSSEESDIEVDVMVKDNWKAYNIRTESTKMTEKGAE